MKHVINTSCGVRAALVVFVGTNAVLSAQDAGTRELEAMVVSAMRAPQAAADVTSAVTVLDPQELENRGLGELRNALNEVPGVISTSTAGETGAVGSIYIRGLTTDYTQLVVDGMRLGSSTAPIGNLLGAGRTYDVGGIEVLRGPQGALYGGEAIGGVLWMETPRGGDELQASGTLEGGSFGTLGLRARAGGTEQGVSWFAGGGWEDSNGDGYKQDHKRRGGAGRVEWAVNDKWKVGGTLRLLSTDYANGGLSEEEFRAGLGTMYLQGEVNEIWKARFFAGHYREGYDSDSTYGHYQTDLEQTSLTTEHEVKLSESLRMLGGAFVDFDGYDNSIGVDENRDRYGAHAALEWDAMSDLTCTGALRWEDHDSYGSEWTWRLGAVRRIERTGTRLRASAGTSFHAPSYLDLYGSSFGAGNPKLDAESGLGWDIGVSQAIGKSHTLELAYFHNRIEDRIKHFPAPPVNVGGHSTSDGIELGMSGSWLGDTLDYRVAWTWLHRSLSDQPRNAATADMAWHATDKLSLGAGVTHLSDHSWGGDPLGSHTLARIYGAYQLTEQVKLHARIENLLDEAYQLYSGFGSVTEGPGTGCFAGITVDW